MNNRNIFGIGLVIIALGLVGLLASSAGEEATHLFGKAVWYLPYAALVGSLRFF